MTRIHSPVAHVLLTIVCAGSPLACSNSSNDGNGQSPAGGEEVVVYVPAGAIAQPFEASVEKVDGAGFPDPGKLLSPVFDIGPSGTQFDMPVTIGIRIDPGIAPGTPLEVLRLDEATGDIDTLTQLDVVGNMALVRTDHFSHFVLSQSDQQRCHNIAVAQPAKPLTLNSTGEPVMLPGTLLSQNSAGAGGGAMFSMGSSWAPGDCIVTVSGSFEPGLMGDGELVVRGSTVETLPVPHAADGSFSISVNVGAGPARSLELSDPCTAGSPNHSAQYILEIGSWESVDVTGCVDLCLGVTCGAGTSCNPSTGMCGVATTGQGDCDQHPNSGTCGSSGIGKCIDDLCIMEVNTGVSGDDFCAAEGLKCAGAPVLSPPSAACVAFHPTASVTSTGSGWQQGIYCDNSGGRACEDPGNNTPKTNNCHDCPPCNAGLDCKGTGNQNMASLFVNCVP